MSLDDLRRRQIAAADIKHGTFEQTIDGYARMAVGGNGYFKCPLVTHVEGNLWQGGCRDGITLPDNFKYVISLYHWEKFDITNVVANGGWRYEVEMYDSGDEPDRRLITEIGEFINEARDNNDGDVLVHCQAGLNRSGLCTAMSLMQRGYIAEDAIRKLREGRSHVVLCNQSFENFLLNYNK